ncbi:glycosyltransferase family 4 protein [Priestia aryabhattai]|uniref:glycosyltransferase family 4 protein n=1 Tax=Priestia aryabhattai TaxID=412384 RepID=UPI002E1BBEAB|nr:glycosyltransferase family 4 protein [Priestia aryabhattai]
MKKKKICFIAQFPPPIHGLAKAVDTLYKSNLSREFDFEKVNITDNKQFLKNLAHILRSKADTFYFTISQTRGGNVRDLLIMRLLIMKRKKCIIHLHGGYYRKLVDTSLPKIFKKINYRTISELDGAIVLSNSLKSVFYNMIENEKIFVVPNCIDNEFLIANEEFELKMKSVTEKKVFHILYLSNFIKSKGYPEVLELARLEKERIEKGGERRLHFDFGGKFFEERDKDYFFNYIRRYNLEKYVTYHGVVEGEQKRELLRNSDIFILLTRYSNEGQPISILEAMGNGMMVITTDHAGIPDVVKDKVNGMLCTLDIKIEDIYTYIYTMDPKGMQSFMINNRNKIKKEFNEAKYIENMKKIFDITK